MCIPMTIPDHKKRPTNVIARRALMKDVEFEKESVLMEARGTFTEKMCSRR
jgi:hypothetical protein